MPAPPVVQPLARAWRRFGAGVRTRSDAWWGVAPGHDGLAAARVTPHADGTLAVDALRWLPSAGEAAARRADDLAAAIARPAAPCVLLLSPEEYRVTFLPGLPVAAAERADALRWKLQGEFDFPLDDAVIDCITTPANATGLAHGLWMVAAARSASVAERVAALERAGARVRAVDVAETAQRNLAMRVAQPGRPVALLSLDADRGLLTVGRDDGLLAARSFDPLAASLAACPLDDEMRLSGLHDRIALELQRTFDNIERQYSPGPVSRVVVIAGPGGAALVDALRAALAVPVDEIDTQTLRLRVDDDLLDGQPWRRATWLAIGAAMRTVDPVGAAT